jgi:DNA-binding response OmpR family regulator
MANGAAAAPVYNPAPKRVLLAMDHLESRESLATSLKKDRHAVIELEDGFELFDYLSTYGTGWRQPPPPDVVISDVSLPGMNGPEILAWLRGRGDLTHFVLLAWPQEVERVVGAPVMAATLYEKPVRMQDIRDALFSLVGGSFQKEAAELHARLTSLFRERRLRSLEASQADDSPATASATLDSSADEGAPEQVPYADAPARRRAG